MAFLQVSMWRNWKANRGKHYDLQRLTADTNWSNQILQYTYEAPNSHRGEYFVWY